MANIVSIINSFLADFKKDNHVNSPYANFFVDYCVIKEDGEFMKTSSPNALDYTAWGLLIVHYGTTNYRGYIDSVTTKFLFKKDGSIGRTINFGHWELKNNLYLSNDYGAYVEIPHECKDDKTIMIYFAKILPWIMDCKTQDEVTSAIERQADGIVLLSDGLTREELLVRNMELEKKVQQLEQKLAAIMSVMKD